MFFKEDKLSLETNLTWTRRNSNLMGNSLSNVFTIGLNAQNHPDYKFIYLDLFSNSNGPRLDFIFGLSSIEACDKLSSIIPFDIGEVEVMDSRNVMGLYAFTATISIKNPQHNHDKILSIFDIADREFPTQLPHKHFQSAVDDVLWIVIPKLPNRLENPLCDNLHKKMTNGLMSEIDQVNNLSI